MPSTRPHGVVVGYRAEDNRRFFKIPVAEIRAGRCVDCHAEVLLNIYGVSAVRDRDADVICMGCNARNGAEIDRSLIES